MSTYAKVIADSISDHGCRLTTMEIQTHRFMLPEFNTHRRFSRNSASSRAIPFEKQLQRIDDLEIAYPLMWPAEQKGMQGGDELDEGAIEMARARWGLAYEYVREQAVQLHRLGVHKSVINRLLEPFMWHKIIVSSTEWENFFNQRCSPLAQPEIRILAEMMKTALEESIPDRLGPGDWHLPYIDDDTRDDVELFHTDPTDGDSSFMKINILDTLKKISAARCARVSYLTHDGKRDFLADVRLFDETLKANLHWSPMEHVARPDLLEVGSSNFEGWMQLREILENA